MSARRETVVEVIECDGQKVFQLGTLMFAVLHGEDVFVPANFFDSEKRSMTLIRNGRVVDQGIVEYVGGENQEHYFVGLRQTYPRVEDEDRRGIFTLSAPRFEVGDRLSIEADGRVMTAQMAKRSERIVRARA